MDVPRGLATVSQLWVYPVKSLQGVRVSAAHVEPAGLRGDRAWVVRDAAGDTVSARQAPVLREVVPVLGSEDDVPVGVLVPGAAEPAFGAAADDALSALVGRAVGLRGGASGSGHDVAAVHLVSTAAVGAGPAAATPDACAVEDPRANVWLELVPGAGSERDHVGSVLSAGGAVLRLSRPPKHCLGVYAEVLVPGPIAVGDPVALT